MSDIQNLQSFGKLSQLNAKEDNIVPTELA